MRKRKICKGLSVIILLDMTSNQKILRVFATIDLFLGILGVITTLFIDEHIEYIVLISGIVSIISGICSLMVVKDPEKVEIADIVSLINIFITSFGLIRTLIKHEPYDDVTSEFLELAVTIYVHIILLNIKDEIKDR